MLISASKQTIPVNFKNHSIFQKPMEAVIVNYRRGKKTQKSNQMIIQVNGVDSKEKATALKGKTVIWQTPSKTKKEIRGKISKEHGNNGAVRAIFETGMPGQSLGQKVTVN